MRILIGNGEPASEERFVPAFKAIALRGFGKLRVRRGEQRIEITCDSNVIRSVSTVVSGGTLRIGLEALTWVIGTPRLEIDVSMPELAGLSVSGSAAAAVDAFSGEGVTLAISGSGSINATLDYRHAAIDLSGSASFSGVVAATGLELLSSGSSAAKLLGSAEHAAWKLSGSPSISAADLAAAEADVDMSGSGSAEIRAAKILRARLSGSGELRYRGDPSLASRVSGSARIKRLGA